eukprot:Sro890_g216790.1 Glutamine--tRNA ligase (268) ;mRNA; f:41358-42247
MKKTTSSPIAEPSAKLNREALMGRPLDESWGVNPPELLHEHRVANGSIIRARGGRVESRTIFRYDDTNPEAESKEYMESLRRDLDWLGWKPERITHSSDNFEVLYELASKLIKKGLAYCCDMTKEEIVAQRELARKRAASKNPDLEYLILSHDFYLAGIETFDKMKKGAYDEGTWTLRLKMDFESPNPNMYDLVAYRIKYTPHPHATDKEWCIYPSYCTTSPTESAMLWRQSTSASVRWNLNRVGKCITGFLPSWTCTDPESSRWYA